MNEAINIRGLGNANNTYVFGEPMGVPVNIDGVYYQWPGTWSLDIPDLVGVDVLKGPQGTAGGFESLSGVINVHTADRSFTPQEKVEVPTESYGLIQARRAQQAPSRAATGPHSALRFSPPTSRVTSAAQPTLQRITTISMPRQVGFNSYWRRRRI